MRLKHWYFSAMPSIIVHQFKYHCFGLGYHFTFTFHLPCGDDRWGVADDMGINLLQAFLSFTRLINSFSFRSVHSLMLSSHLFYCLPFLLFPNRSMKYMSLQVPFLCHVVKLFLFSPPNCGEKVFVRTDFLPSLSLTASLVKWSL